MKKTIIITGATSGFGKSMAQKFAANGYQCIITGRREDKLLAIAKELESQFDTEILPLVFDVQDKQAVFNAIGSLPEQWKSIDILINNAGLALGRDNFDSAELSDWESMIDTNLKGLLYVSKAVLPLMIARNQGHIINLGSTAGKEVYAAGNVYCVTKHAVDAISKSMRIDLLPHKIKVTAIHPGAADTDFSMVRFKGDDAKANQVYEGYTPLHAEDIADIAFYCASLPSHVCINDLVVTCTAQANATLVYKDSSL